MNTAVELSGEYMSEHPTELNIKQFRVETDHWVMGPIVCFNNRLAAEQYPPNAHVILARKTTVALLVLPQGLEWAANYVDETTGMAMRALCDWDLCRDQLMLRWDVLCG